MIRTLLSAQATLTSVVVPVFLFFVSKWFDILSKKRKADETEDIEDESESVEVFSIIIRSLKRSQFIIIFIPIVFCIELISYFRQWLTNEEFIYVFIVFYILQILLTMRAITDRPKIHLQIEY
ncbi:MAG: hypothetical protein FJW63_09885 [Actinobacteria bacterium]|nr:hypothetical protein [Actinomycetota bacterium]